MRDYFDFFSTTMGGFVRHVLDLVGIGLTGYNTNFNEGWRVAWGTFKDVMLAYFTFFGSTLGVRTLMFIPRVPVRATPKCRNCQTIVYVCANI